MAVNRCRHFVHVLKRRSLLTTSGVKCTRDTYFPKSLFSSDSKSIGNKGDDVLKGSVITNFPTNHSTGSDYSDKAEEDDHKLYEETIKLKILNASLPFVHNHGWSKEAISAGAESLGYPGIVHGMFPRGGAELIQHFYANCNHQLVEKLKAHVGNESNEENVVDAKEQSFNVATKTPKDSKVVIAFAVETRLRMIEPYISHWPQALAIMTLPPNVPTSLANLLTLVDDIWYYAGDRSVDFNWYTRRVALASIYKMTELYMIQDGSEDHQATWTFLNRRLDEAAQLHSLFVQSESAAQFAKDIALSTFITARNMLGTNWNR